jgi:hypothetical protein
MAAPCSPMMMAPSVPTVLTGALMMRVVTAVARGTRDDASLTTPDGGGANQKPSCDEGDKHRKPSHW